MPIGTRHGGFRWNLELVFWIFVFSFSQLFVFWPLSVHDLPSIRMQKLTRHITGVIACKK